MHPSIFRKQQALSRCPQPLANLRPALHPVNVTLCDFHYFLVSNTALFFAAAQNLDSSLSVFELDLSSVHTWLAYDTGFTAPEAQRLDTSPRDARPVLPSYSIAHGSNVHRHIGTEHHHCVMQDFL